MTIKRLIGSDPNQIPLNRDLGTMAYQDLAALQGPTFTAYQSGGQSIANVTWTKVSFNTKLFDTAGAFDAVTNYRFQPLIPGYYQVNGAVYYGSGSGWSTSNVRKNGGGEIYGSSVNATPNGMLSNTNRVVYLNGSDYIELWTYQSTGAAASTVSSIEGTAFSAALVRLA